MSKSSMLRTRRRDVNVKPNRRLDRKSSRGMIYENEELRLRTININAEIERGQSDIKKLRRENEALRKEIWCLRDEYEKLDKLLKDKEDTSCSSCTSDSESCTSATESSENEASQNLENVQKTNMHSLRTEFDHLSVVTEETSAECSDKNSCGNSLPKETWNILPPDQSYPNCQTLPLDPSPVLGPVSTPKHFFAPIRASYEHINGFGEVTWPCDGLSGVIPENPVIYEPQDLKPCEKTSSDLIVKTDAFANFSQESQGSTNSFVNGGNLEELLQDIQTISNDILQISGDINRIPDEKEKPYKTELSVVLMPKPMPLLGFEKYGDLKASIENLKKSSENLQKEDKITYSPIVETPLQRVPSNPFFYNNLENIQNAEKLDYVNLGFRNDKNKLNGLEEECNNETNINNEVKNPGGSKEVKVDKKEEKSPKKTRKVSIYFKGKKDKLARSLSLDTKLTPKPETPKVTPSPVLEKKLDDKVIQKTDSKTSIFEPKDDKINSDAKTSSDSKNSYDRKHRKSSSTSPERKHLHVKLEDSKKGHKRRHRKSERRQTRRTSVSLDRQRDRSFSVCTDRSHILDHRFGHFDDCTNSERERTNSMSSCETIKSRKNSIQTFQVAGKIPWFGCWGNGCI